MNREELKNCIIKLIKDVNLIYYSEKLNRYKTLIKYKNGSEIYIKNYSYDSFSETIFDIKLYIETVDKNFLWFKYKVKKYENIDKAMLVILFSYSEYNNLETSVVNSHYTHLKKIAELEIDNLCSKDT